MNFTTTVHLENKSVPGEAIVFLKSEECVDAGTAGFHAHHAIQRMLGANSGHWEVVGVNVRDVTPKEAPDVQDDTDAKIAREAAE